MANKAMVPFLVGMMLLTGVCNTLLTKYQDNQCVHNCSDPDPRHRKRFEQPVIQTAQMFVGEAGCWLVVGLLKLWRAYVAPRLAGRAAGYQPVDTQEPSEPSDSRESGPDGGDGDGRGSAGSAKPGLSVLRGWRVLLLALPAVCDILGTTLMNAGLLLVAASIYQMTRGALVLFVGLFSVLFLKRHLHLFQWVSLVGVVLGVAVVGLAGALSPDPQRPKGEGEGEGEGGADPSADPAADALRAIIGVLLIAGAQIFTATQFVLEEWMLEKSDIEPLKVVGYEGVFGLGVTLAVMLILHLAVGITDAGRGGYFDAGEGWRQMTEYPAIWISSFLIMLSIGGFNFFGLSVTRSVSATSRSTIDTCRTLFIWIVSLGLGWETFKWLQVVGFALLVYFTFLFNGLVQPPFAFLKPQGEVEELLPEEPIEHN